MKLSAQLYSLIALTISAGIFQADNCYAGNKTPCPAFNTGMVDAAAMAFGLSPGAYTSIAVENDPTLPMIYCKIIGAPTSFVFRADVNYSDPNYAEVFGKGSIEDDPDYDTRLYSDALQLSPAQMRACRTEILKSFVWKNYCAPALQ
ncbi:MAG: hypothetical protein WBP44_12275 [Gammaproteobacteria bacterium]|jgi:hypothetical protein